MLDTRLLRVQAPVHALLFAALKPGSPAAEGSHVLTCVMGDKQIRRYRSSRSDATLTLTLPLTLTLTFEP